MIIFFEKHIFFDCISCVILSVCSHKSCATFTFHTLNLLFDSDSDLKRFRFKKILEENCLLMHRLCNIGAMGDVSPSSDNATPLHNVQSTMHNAHCKMHMHNAQCMCTMYVHNPQSTMHIITAHQHCTLHCTDCQHCTIYCSALHTCSASSEPNQ